MTALLTMKLQTNVKPLPKDSTLIVRPRSALGLKYVEITQGRARADGKGPGLEDGATVPLTQATPAAGRDRPGVQHVQRADARRPARSTCYEFGNAFAGRGQDLNVAIQDAPTRC